MKQRNIVLLVVAITVIIAGTMAAFAAGGTPGSEGDPLVSKSYVDDKTSYKSVQLTAGQTLIGGEGTEIILRSGEATAIDNGANGVSDITSGIDLMTGMQVGLNHLLLIPKDDGRGIRVSTEAWVMIRGDYSIK